MTGSIILCDPREERLIMSERSVVWILGAGFSRPLGGPLLKHFFSEGSREMLEATYLRTSYGELYGDLPFAVRQIYQHGKKNAAWDNAEEFLDYVDTAASSGEAPARERIMMMLEELSDPKYGDDAIIPGLQHRDHATLLKINGTARRLLAAECCAFLRKDSMRRERWQPFHFWASQLSARDTVITFNYDMVVEQLLSREGNEVFQKPCSLATPLPSQLSNDGRAYAQLRLLKLHGSVNWRVTGAKDNETVSVGSVDSALTSSLTEIAITGPGPGKLERANKLYAPLWDAATDAIRKADAIVFVGYRFPPTDAFARRTLLDAIRATQHTGLNAMLPSDPATARHVAVHTVLGPRLQDEDPVRLQAMLKNVLEPPPPIHVDGAKKVPTFFSLHAHALYAEDFLTVVTREKLFERETG